MERLDDIAAGARGLRVLIEKGDIMLRAGQGLSWSIEYDSKKPGEPHTEREGDTLSIRQRGGGRLDVRVTAPPGLERVELRTGAGRVEAEGVQGRTRVTSGNGALVIRGMGGEAEINTGNGAVDVAGFEGTLTATSGNGRIQATRLQGQATLRSGNGRVEVLDAAGALRASSGNGDVTVTRSEGTAELNTGHGAVEVTAPRALGVRATTGMGVIRVDDGSVRDLRLKSMMGEVRCSAALEPGRHELETAMGQIVLELPADIAARVEAQTSFGQVQSDFPLVRVGRSGPMSFGGARMVGSIGEGEPRVDISLRSSKGTITLRRLAGAAARPSAPSSRERATSPSGPHEPSPTLAVLEALARGEITPAEAEDLLSR